MDTKYSVKVTRIGNNWGVRVYVENRWVVQTLVTARRDIGPAARDLLTTIDKCGGDRFTWSARKRRNKDLSGGGTFKHTWNSNGYRG